MSNVSDLAVLASQFPRPRLLHGSVLTVLISRFSRPWFWLHSAKAHTFRAHGSSFTVLSLRFCLCGSPWPRFWHRGFCGHGSNFTVVKTHGFRAHGSSFTVSAVIALASRFCLRGSDFAVLALLFPRSFLASQFSQRQFWLHSSHGQ